MPNDGERGRETQSDLILNMLLNARDEGCGVEIPDFMRAGISAFNGRIMDLRRRGYGIENEQWLDEEGRRHSPYWLKHTPKRGRR